MIKMETAIPQTTTSTIEDSIDELLSNLFDASIEHYGTPRHSGRYPYGSGERPYQSLEGSKSSKKAVKAYNKEVQKLIKKKAKEDAASKKKAEREQKEQEQKEAREKKKREEVLRNPGKLKERQYDYTEEEVQEALRRFDWDQKLHEYNQKRLKRGADYMSTFVKYMSTGTAMYNLGANAYNAFNKDKKDVPLINVGGGSKDTSKKKPKDPDKDK